MTDLTPAAARIAAIQSVLGGATAPLRIEGTSGAAGSKWIAYVGDRADNDVSPSKFAPLYPDPWQFGATPEEAVANLLAFLEQKLVEHAADVARVLEGGGAAEPKADQSSMDYIHDVGGVK